MHGGGKYELADHVRVTEPCQLFSGATGTVSDPASSLLLEHGWESFKKTINVDQIGEVRLYWIWFDHPQTDPLYEGPISGAAIAEDCLSICE